MEGRSEGGSEGGREEVRRDSEKRGERLVGRSLAGQEKIRKTKKKNSKKNWKLTRLFSASCCAILLVAVEVALETFSCCFYSFRLLIVFSFVIGRLGSCFLLSFVVVLVFDAAAAAAAI